MISQEPGSQVPNDYTTLVKTIYLHIHYFRSWLHQQVEGGGDEGKADVLDHLRLPRGHRDGALLQVHLEQEVVNGVDIVELW